MFYNVVDSAILTPDNLVGASWAMNLTGLGHQFAHFEFLARTGKDFSDLITAGLLGGIIISSKNKRYLHNKRYPPTLWPRGLWPRGFLLKKKVAQKTKHLSDTLVVLSAFELRAGPVH